MRLSNVVLIACASVLFAALPKAVFSQTPPDGGTRFQPFKSVWSGVYTKDEAERGARVAAELCARCHGANLAGGATAPGLTGPKFFERWHDLRLADIVTYIQSAMPREHEFFVPGESARSIVALILQDSGIPPGREPMPTDVQALSEILITRRPTK